MTDIWQHVSSGLALEVDANIANLRAEEWLQKCGSEIELAFAVSLILGFRVCGVEVAASRSSESTSAAVYLEPQVVIGGYRVDFLFGEMKDAGELLKAFVIECDGHEWHERTKEQAAKDKSRDRFLSGKVGRVLRFTGSEIFKNPLGCIAEVSEIFGVMA